MPLNSIDDFKVSIQLTYLYELIFFNFFNNVNIVKFKGIFPFKWIHTNFKRFVPTPNLWRGVIWNVKLVWSHGGCKQDILYILAILFSTWKHQNNSILYFKLSSNILKQMRLLDFFMGISSLLLTLKSNLYLDLKNTPKVSPTFLSFFKGCRWFLLWKQTLLTKINKLECSPHQYKDAWKKTQILVKTFHLLSSTYK